MSEGNAAVEVTQADREAAWPFLRNIVSQYGDRMFEKSDLDKGWLDARFEVQAFARHRLSASTSDETARLREAGKRLIAVFDQQRMTAAERIIAGISDAGLRTEGNAAIEALRAALQSQDIPS